MKITSLMSTGVLEFNDLGSYIKGVSPILRSIRLNPGESKFLVETGEVLLSAQAGDIHRFAAAAKISVDAPVTLGAGGSVVMTHNFGFIPKVTVIKITAGPVQTDFTANADIVITHDAAYNVTTVTSTAGGTFQIRLS
jgi:hypothetical protein